MNYFKCLNVVSGAAILLSGLHIETKAQQKVWRKIQPMSTARYFSKAAPISDHEILVIGGYTSDLASTASCEVIDVLTGTVSEAESLVTGRTEFGMVQLPDSNIVVLGGENAGPISSIELYDRGSKKWIKIGDLLVPRRQLTAQLISPTKILTVGGRSRDLSCLRDCEIFDLKTRKSHIVQDYPVLTSLCMVERTSDGTIVAFGGREGGPGSLRHKEIYAFDMASEKWRLHGSYPNAIYFPYVVTLNDGRLFSTGGSYQESGNSDNQYSDLLAIESSAEFDSVGHLLGPRDLHCSSLFDDESVIVVGGANDKGYLLSSCEIVDPEAGTSVAGPELNDVRDLFNIVRLKPAALKERLINSVLVAIGGRGEDGNPTKSVEVLEVSCDGQKLVDLMALAGAVKVNGSATWFGRRLRLTDTAQNDSGSAWYVNRISIRTGFETDFTFRIGSGNDKTQPDGGDPGADGIAFVVQNSSTKALGRFGKGIGYAGIPKSIAVEFDTYFNFESNDPNGNHVAVQTGGTLANQVDHKAPFLLGSSSTLETIHNDGRPYFARISYDGNAMYVYVNETGVFTTPVLTVTNVNISSLIGLGPDPTVWMGFTSATGIAWAQHEILDWKIRGCVEVRTPSDVEYGATSTEGQVKIELSPNPVNAVLTLTITGDVTQASTVQIFDVRGATVLSQSLGLSRTVGEQIPIDVSTLPVGCYIVRVECGKSAISSQLLVVH